MRAIRVTVNNDLKVVQYWCSKEDTQKDSFFEDIEKAYILFATDKKWRKVIYRSGDADLLDLTSDLLKHNRGLTA